MPELNPLTLGETPDDYLELEDGSVVIPSEEAVEEPGNHLDNLVLTLDESKQRKLASAFLEAIEADRKAREKRQKQYEDGIRRTGLGDDAPGGAEFEGASRVVHPVLAEATVDFAASAIKELFPPSGPVKTTSVGDLQEEQLARAERKRQYMNWQLTTQISEYRSELEQLLTQLPMGGSQYQKFWWDDRLRRPACEFVPIDDILLPFVATSFYTSPRVTHVLHLTRMEFDRRTKSGLYREVEVGDPESVERTSAALANDKVEGKDGEAYDEDGLRDLYEIHAYADIEGDYAPYIITIDAFSEKVLAIYRNWDEQDPTQQKLDWLVEWKFIPWRGAYAIGLPHLIGGLSGAATGALRALLDSAHIANAPTVMKLKGGRVVGQRTSVDLTEVCEIDAPPGVTDIRQVAMPMPFPGPNPVLFQLLGWLTEAAKGVVTTAEEKIADAGNQMPVGTALALIEQGSKVFSSIHARMHESQKRALQILNRINGTFLSEQEEVQELGKLVVNRSDFTGTLDVEPVSDPNVFSEAQRFAQMQGVDQMVASAPQLPWNIYELKRRQLQLMHVDNPDLILPKQPKPVTADPSQENFVATTGVAIQAGPKQDHMAHVMAHLKFILSKQNDPLANGQALGGILAHVGQHREMLFHQGVQAMAQQVAMEAQFSGQQLTPDAVMSMAQDRFFQLAGQQLQQLDQMCAQAQQVVQAKTPPPPMPPEVQASIQIAQLETQRRTQADAQQLALKQLVEQNKTQLAQAEFAAEERRKQQEAQFALIQQQVENQFKQAELYIKGAGEEMRGQVELMKNEEDNRQYQMTELMKNFEDNQTQFQIAVLARMEHIETQNAAMREREVAPPPADNSAQLEEMRRMLEEIRRAKTDDALGATIEGLRAAIETMGRPKMLIKDLRGNTIGVQ